MLKNFTSKRSFVRLPMTAATIAALLSVANAQPVPQAHTTVSSAQSIYNHVGPFDSDIRWDDSSESATYSGGLPGILSTESKTHTRLVKGNVEFSEVTEWTNYYGTSQQVETFTGLTVGGDPLGAAVTEVGSAHIQAYYKSFSRGDDQSHFGSTANAGWADSWMIAANDDHALGTAGRLRLTLSLDGLYGVNRIVPPEDITYPGVKMAGAVAQLGTSSLSVDSVWTTDSQHHTSSAYIDFLYGESFVTKFDLTASELRKIGLIELTATESFSAAISEVVLPLGTTLDHSFGSFRVANSSDANLYPSAPVPEVSTFALMLAGLGAIGLVGRRRVAKASARR